MSRLLEQTSDIPFVLGWLTALASIVTAKRVAIDSRIPILIAGMILMAISSVLAMIECAQFPIKGVLISVGADWTLGHDILMMRFLAAAPLVFAFFCSAAHHTVRLSPGTVLCSLCSIVALADITLLCVCLTTLFKRPQWVSETAHLFGL